MWIWMRFPAALINADWWTYHVYAHDPLGNLSMCFEINLHSKPKGLETEVLSTREDTVFIVFFSRVIKWRKMNHYIRIQSALSSITYILLIELSRHSSAPDLVSDLVKYCGLLWNIQLISPWPEPSPGSVLKGLKMFIFKHFESNVAFIYHACLILQSEIM